MPSVKRRRSLFVGIAALGALSGAGPRAWSADAAPKANELEEIVVTAQKRTENVQKIGSSVQALSAEGLERAGIQDVSRLENVAPGVVFAKGGNDAKIALRGANSNATFADNTSIVGVFVDGVYKPRASQQTRAFFDVERAEILKGPQGTLYGRNTLGGAINLYTKAPNLDDDHVSFSINSSYARFNDFHNELTLNAPVSETLGFRLAVLSDKSDGWIKNLVGRNEGIKDTLSVRASMLWKPRDNINALLRLSSINENGNPAGMFAIAGACRAVDANGLTDPLGPVFDCRNPRRGSGGTPSFNAFGSLLTIARDFINDDRLREKNATLSLDFDLGAVALKSISSVTDYTSLLGNDMDYSANPHGREWVQENNKSLTQELQLSSKNESALKWTTGLYASKDKLFFAFSSFRHTLDNLSVRTPTPSANGVLFPLLIGTPLLSNTTQINNASNTTQFIDSKVLGVFGQVNYALRDNLRVIGGLRYSSEKKDAVNGNAPYLGTLTPAVVPSTPVNFVYNPNTATAKSNTSRTFKNTTWRAGVEYDVRDQVLTYATASTGFLSGVMNQNGSVTNPQKSKSYEIGIKSRFHDNRVQLNAALYRATYRDLATTFQIPNPASPGSVLTLSSNGGDITAKGLELTLDVIPVDKLRLSFGASYMDAKYGIFGLNLPQQVLNGVIPLLNGVQQRFVNLNGRQPPYTPKVTASLRGSYDFVFDSGTLTPVLQSRYSDSYSAAGGLPFDPAGFQKSFTQTDLRLGWTSNKGRYGLEAFVENLENEITNQRTQHGGDGIEQANYGYPRNYGVRVKLNF